MAGVLVGSCWGTVVGDVGCCGRVGEEDKRVEMVSDKGFPRRVIGCFGRNLRNALVLNAVSHISQAQVY